jgi:thiosulfate/3-mercaptopyruvate sulfurtransferase
MQFRNNFIRKVTTIIFSLLLLIGVSSTYQNALAGDNVQPLVETGWLAKNLDNNDLKIIHMATPGGKKEHFDMKHIPGSMYIGLGEVMPVLGNGDNPPDKAGFEALMGRLGISNDSHVVVVGGSQTNPFISGVFWLMKYNGHDKVSMLNGGVGKWIKEGKKTSNKPASVKAAKYSASPDSSILANADQVLASINNSKAVIVDVRNINEYTGKDTSMGNKRLGHIPGVKHIDFYSTNLNQDGTFKSASDLKAAYEAKGVTKDKEVITYCQGGIRAAHTHFVLQYMLGYPNVRNYVGSWAEWSRLDPAKYPVEK